jgi:cell division protein FtsZ
LLNDNDIYNSKKILLSITFSNEKGENQTLTMDEMNDVNDFMDRFGSEFELKWGLAVDPELGKRVKVTILATGFGIDDVDGMSSHLKKHTEEEAQRIAEEEERAAERQDRRNRYYGKDSNNTQYKRRPQIFRFRPEDLDNEDIILAVENTPTYKRTKQMLKDIMGTGVEEKEDNYTDNTVEGVISFV